VREEQREISERRFYGSLNAASPVKRIDPKTEAVVKVIESGIGR
jgi:hypothetical protein